MYIRKLRIVRQKVYTALLVNTLKKTYLKQDGWWLASFVSKYLATNITITSKILTDKKKEKNTASFHSYLDSGALEVKVFAEIAKHIAKENKLKLF